MNHEQIIEFNKKCAQFLGYIKTVSGDDFYYVEHENYNAESCLPKLIELNYESRFVGDWNWIMEIIEIIENLPNKNVYFSKTSLGEYSVEITHEIAWHPSKLENKIVFVRNVSKKEAVIEALDKFLTLVSTTKQ